MHPKLTGDLSPGSIRDGDEGPWGTLQPKWLQWLILYWLIALGTAQKRNKGLETVYVCTHEDMLIGYLLSVWCQGIRGLVFHMSDRCPC